MIKIRSMVWLALFLFITNSAVAAIRPMITVGTEATYPPFEFMATDGRITGFDVELIEALCDKLSLDCKVVHLPFESLILNLQQDRIDAVISMIAITPERASQVAFTDVYYINKPGIIALDQVFPLANIKNLKGKIIGVQKGSNFEQYIVDTYAGLSKIYSYGSINDALLDLANKRLHCVIGDMPILQWWLTQQKNKACYQIRSLGNVLKTSLSDQKVAIAVNRKNKPLVQALNQALLLAQADGTYARLKLKYFSRKLPSAQGFFPQLLEGAKLTLCIAFCALVLGLIFAIFFAWGSSSPITLLRIFIRSILVACRSLPEIIVLLGIYFSVSKLLHHTAWLNGKGSMMVAGILSLSLIFSAYASKVLLNAYKSISSCQLLSAKALGLSKYRIYVHILGSQIIRLALPGLHNLWLILLKDTSLISLLGMSDLLNKAKLAAQTTYQPFTFYAIAACIYLVITAVSQAGIQKMIKIINRPY